MRNYVVASLVMLPLLLTFSYSAQTWSVDPPGQPWVFSSEDLFLENCQRHIVHVQ